MLAGPRGEAAMPGTKRADRPHYISQGDQFYPDRLVLRLGPDAPKGIAVVGSATALSAPMTAFLCSKETPGATILKAFDQAAAWRDAGLCVSGVFPHPVRGWRSSDRRVRLLLRLGQLRRVAFSRSKEGVRISGYWATGSRVW